MSVPRSRSAPLPQRRGLRLGPPSPPRLWLLLLLLLLAAVGSARGWESEDLELFDLVEEVQLNFYHFLGVQQVSAEARAGPGGRKERADAGGDLGPWAQPSAPSSFQPREDLSAFPSPSPPLHLL
jgi:hypothetical protein